MTEKKWAYFGLLYCVARCTGRDESKGWRCVYKKSRTCKR